MEVHCNETARLWLEVEVGWTCFDYVFSIFDISSLARMGHSDHALPFVVSDGFIIVCESSRKQQVRSDQTPSAAFASHTVDNDNVAIIF